MLQAIQVKLQPVGRDMRTGSLPFSTTSGSPMQPGRQQSLKTSAEEQIEDGIADVGVVAASCVEVKGTLEGLEVG